MKVLLYELDFNYLLINTDFQNICSIIKFMPATIRQKLEKTCRLNLFLQRIEFLYCYIETVLIGKFFIKLENYTNWIFYRFFEALNSERTSDFVRPAMSAALNTWLNDCYEHSNRNNSWDLNCCDKASASRQTNGKIQAVSLNRF